MPKLNIQSDNFDENYESDSSHKTNTFWNDENLKKNDCNAMQIFLLLIWPAAHAMRRVCNSRVHIYMDEWTRGRTRRLCYTLCNRSMRDRCNALERWPEHRHVVISSMDLIAWNRTLTGRMTATFFLRKSIFFLSLLLTSKIIWKCKIFRISKLCKTWSSLN